MRRTLHHHCHHLSHRQHWPNCRQLSPVAEVALQRYLSTSSGLKPLLTGRSSPIHLSKSPFFSPAGGPHPISQTLSCSWPRRCQCSTWVTEKSLLEQNLESRKPSRNRCQFPAQQGGGCAAKDAVMTTCMSGHWSVSCQSLSSSYSSSSYTTTSASAWPPNTQGWGRSCGVGRRTLHARHRPTRVTICYARFEPLLPWHAPPHHLDVVALLLSSQR